MASETGARIVARGLRDLGVTVIFGLVGIPVVNIAEEAINLGIRFIAFRNEQACSYAASAYGYLTGKPGVCLVVGGPGVLHAIAGIGNSSANAFPMIMLAGSVESNLVTKGAFQEMDAISLLTPHTKLAIRPRSPEQILSALQNAYRTSWFGRPGTGFIDLPADVIQEVFMTDDHASSQKEWIERLSSPNLSPESSPRPIPPPPKPAADPASLSKASQVLKSAKAPLIVIGKGAAYARAESWIRKLVDSTQIPFLPTPMGKGVVPDSHPLNAASARSTALQQADVVLILGARLNWILHYGEPPKWSPKTRFIQVDISAEEIGRNAGSTDLGIVGDLSVVVPQLLSSLANWRYYSQSFTSLLNETKFKNETNSLKKASQPTKSQEPMTYQRAFEIIKSNLHSFAHPDDGSIVYISEGANTMDISRSIFPVHQPRLRLDAGTYATMGVGLGYAIAAYAAYNFPPTSRENMKKIVAIEGDSALGFSAAEIETMARNSMAILIFVINNSGVYSGSTTNAEAWNELQRQSSDPTLAGPGRGLRSTTLGYETRYEMLAEMCGGKGYFARTEEELAKATREGFQNKVVTVVNVIVEAGIGKKVEFAWQKSAGGSKKGTAKL